MKKIKKHLTFFLVMTLIMSSFSVTAFADQSENGEHSNQYNCNTDTENNNGYGNGYENGYKNGDENGNGENGYDAFDNGVISDEESAEIVASMFEQIGAFGATSNIPFDYDVEVGKVPGLNIPTWEQLKPGEVWSGKMVEYPKVETFLDSGEWVSDGTAIIYIYIRGRPYNGALLALDGNDQRRVFVEADIDEFQFTDDFLVTWDTSHPENVWNFNFDSVSRILSFYVDEEAINSPTEPFWFWYHVYLDEDPNWKINHWYSTDSVSVKFEPHMSNLFYWTKEERTEPEFSATINWNNGNGMKFATIDDHILGITIRFESNINTKSERQRAADVPWSNHTFRTDYWSNNARIAGQPNVPVWWHLYWEKGDAPKTYIITVHELGIDADGNPVDIIYVLNLTSTGGHAAVPAGRYRVSEYFFKRDYDPNGKRFTWDEKGRLVQTSTSVAQIMLTYKDMPLGALSVVKLAEPRFDGIVWYYDDENWTFTAGLRTAGGDFAKFAPVFDNGTPVPNTYRFNGFTSSDIFEKETTLTFRRVGTSDTSQTITILDLPAYEAVADILNGTPLMYELVEFFTYEILGLIDVYYGIGANPPTTAAIYCSFSNTFATSSFDVDNTLTTPRFVTLRNVFDYGIGFLNVLKLLDGFPGDWDIDRYSIFYVRIFNVDTQSYLLFYPYLITQLLQEKLPIKENPAFNNTWWCVGNHKQGLTAAYDSDMIPIMELPISVLEYLKLSNLWTGMRYEVREVKRVEGVSESDTIAAWGNFWNSKVNTDANNRLSYFIGNTWQQNELDIWLVNHWIGETEAGSSLWEPVRPITCDLTWHADKDWTWGVIYPTTNEETKTFHPTRPLGFNQTETVVFTNRFRYHGGDLRIMKELCANALAWGITDDTVFYARVWADEESALVFVPEKLNHHRVIGIIELEDGVKGDFTPWCPGVRDFGKPSSWAIDIPFWVNMPAVLIQIPVHPYAQLLYYTVEEIIPDKGIPGLLSVEYFVKDSDEIELKMPFGMVYDETITLTIRNNFQHRDDGSACNNCGICADCIGCEDCGVCDDCRDGGNGGSSGGGGNGGSAGGGDGSGGGLPSNNQTDGILPCQAFLIGTPDGLINPRNNITRAEIATVFFRMISDETRENYWLQENPFADVQLHQWFNNAVSTTVNMGLFEGVYEGGFAPNQAITRGELAAVLVRFMVAEDHATLTDYENRFNDIGGHWARDYINIAAGEGWIQGDEGLGGAFRPGERLTRAEAAAMINRIFGCLVPSHEELLPNMVAWPDNQNVESWYFLYIKMATNSYEFSRQTPDARYKTLHNVLEPRDWSVLERPDSTPRGI